MDYDLKGVERYELTHKSKKGRYYVDEARWMSYYYQMRLILSNANKGEILEIGPGNNFLKKLIESSIGTHHTFDIDVNSNPTFSSISELKAIEDSRYDLICAFQVLEHMPYSEALEMIELLFAKVRKTILISLPVATPAWRIHYTLPKLKEKNILIKNCFVKKRKPKFDGCHYWELENSGIEINNFIAILSKWSTVNSFRNFYNPYHYFFECLKK